MGILRKGILSTPRGKVGEFMGYRRNGKDILSALPSNPNAFSNIWKGYEPQAIKQLTILWNAFRSLEQSQWAAIAPPGISGLEFFIEQNLPIVKAYNRPNIAGVKIGATVNNPVMGISVPYNLQENSIVVTLRETILSPQGNLYDRIRVRGFVDNQWTPNQFNAFASSSIGSFKLFLPANFADKNVFLWFQFFRPLNTNYIRLYIDKNSRSLVNA